jgi:tetratricopeptide (TPR) repeat protein
MVIRKVRRAILLLCYLLAFLMPFTGSAGVTLWRAEAARAEQATHYTAAIRAYLTAANWQPSDPLLYRRVGAIYLLQGRLPLAENALWRAYLLDMHDVDTLSALGDLDVARGDPASAISWYQQACSQPSTRATPYVALGKAQISIGDLPAAISAFQGALAATPDQTEAHYFLGLLLVGGDAQAAQTHLAQVAKTDSPLQARARELLAALERIAPLQDVAARAGELGLAYIRQRVWRLAADQMSHLVELAPDNAEACAYLGYALYQLGEYETAEQTLQKALQLDGESAQTHHFLGMFYLNRGWIYSAVEALGKAYALDSGNPAIAADIAQAYMDAGAYEEAESWYEEVAELAPQDGRYALLQAAFHIDQVYHVRDRGLPVAKRAIALLPDEAVAHDLYGWGLFLSGDVPQARAALEKALSLDATRATTHYHLAQVYARLGDISRARAHYERVIDLDTSNTLRPQAERELASGK